MKNIKRYLSLMLAIVLLISTISMTGIVTSAAEPSATPYSDRNIVFQWFTRNPNSALTQETVTVDEGVTNATQGLKITTHSQNGSFNLNFWKETNHAVATDITDIIDDAYVSFYIQLPEGSDNKALKLQLRNNTGKSVTGLYEFTVAKGGEWQEVTVKVSDIPNITEFALDQLYVINVQCPVGQLAIGDQFTVANVHMWHPDTQEDTPDTPDTPDSSDTTDVPYAERNVLFQWLTRSPSGSYTHEVVNVDESVTNTSQGRKITAGSNGAFDLSFWKELKHGDPTDISAIIDDAYITFYIQLPEGSNNKKLNFC